MQQPVNGKSKTAHHGRDDGQPLDAAPTGAVPGFVGAARELQRLLSVARRGGFLGSLEIGIRVSEKEPDTAEEVRRILALFLLRYLDHLAGGHIVVRSGNAVRSVRFGAGEVTGGVLFARLG